MVGAPLVATRSGCRSDAGRTPVATDKRCKCPVLPVSSNGLNSAGLKLAEKGTPICPRWQPQAGLQIL
eukprot:13280576-Alexandrium_andersonii.AAC.1